MVTLLGGRTSRTAALNSVTQSALNKVLAEHGIEVPMLYESLCDCGTDRFGKSIGKIHPKNSKNGRCKQERGERGLKLRRRVGMLSGVMIYNNTI